MTAQDIVEAAEHVVAGLLARGHHLELAYAGVSTAYHSDEAASGAWMSTFFEGYFRPSHGGRPDATLFATEDPWLYRSLGRWASQSPGAGPAPEPASASGRKDHTTVPVDDGVTLVRTRATKVSPQEDVFTLLFAEQRRVVLVTPGRPEVRREEAMQTLRALTKWLLLERGWVPMHSACVAHTGRAVCIAGGKASGKTSTLLNLLLRSGCDLVAIDKFLLRESGAHLEVCGLPGKAGVRIGTAAVLPPLLDWVASEEHPFFATPSADEVHRIAASNTPEQLRTRKEKILILPSELSHLLKTSITAIAPLHLLLVPVFDLELTEPRLVAGSVEHAASLLSECYVGLDAKGEDALLPLFDLSDVLLRQRLADMLERHLGDIEVYELHQNHATNEQAARLVSALLASSG
jgi:hypothetical protein